MKYNICVQSDCEQRGRVGVGVQFGAAILLPSRGEQCYLTHRTTPELNRDTVCVMRVMFTWTDAETRNNPDNTAHTDVTHEVKLRLSGLNTNHESAICVWYRKYC